MAKNNRTSFFYVVYFDKTWVFDQSERAQIEKVVTRRQQRPGKNTTMDIIFMGYVRRKPDICCVRQRSRGFASSGDEVYGQANQTT